MERLLESEKPEGGGRTSCMNIWGKSNRGSKMSKYPGPEMVMCLACFRNQKEASVWLGPSEQVRLVTEDEV